MLHKIYVILKDQNSEWWGDFRKPKMFAFGGLENEVADTFHPYILKVVTVHLRIY